MFIGLPISRIPVLWMREGDEIVASSVREVIFDVKVEVLVYPIRIG
jgi:hypothetical protein